jgi:hypothetical protein
MSVTIDGELGTITKNNSTIDIEEGGLVIPSGNTAQRSQSPVVGMIRLNTDIAKIEGYNGTNWANIEP